MALDTNELADLKERALFAATHGYAIAHAEDYATAMIEEVGDDVPTGAERYSAEHLHQLVMLVEKSRASRKVVTKPVLRPVSRRVVARPPPVPTTEPDFSKS